ncbi:RapZ C-terminal domain-containing protein [Kitasatospora cineracea]|uniref:RapZ C-terminal domain-containing protein n=1 Tax=Kitasatospora cineracea TaxID=88074 RepID=UPI0036A34ECD
MKITITSFGYGHAVGCAGGRHRAPTVAHALAAVLNLQDYDVAVLHRDLHRDVIDR